MLYNNEIIHEIKYGSLLNSQDTQKKKLNSGKSGSEAFSLMMNTIISAILLKIISMLLAKYILNIK